MNEYRHLVLLSASMILAACDGSTTNMASGQCQLTSATTATAKVAPSGCAILSRDTTACDAERKAAGLSGFWLKFSCRVKLGKTTGATPYIQATADGLPDYKSNYFATTDPCYDPSTASGHVHNPNSIASKSYVIQFPQTPSGASQPMTGAVVGLSINGVPVFGNFAAPGDDIFREAMTFDTCGAHPTPTSAYHYHSEPYSISYDDSNFIGVLRDGSPIYGRRDPDGSLPTLDTTGGHSGVTVDSPSTAIYHYHVNEQTSTTAGTAGQKQWFLTKGSYHAAPAPCTTCM